MSETAEGAALAGQVALITGGAGGLGMAIARRFALAGAHVVINDLDAGAATAAAKELTRLAGDGQRVLAVPADAADPDQVETMFGELSHTLGQLDVLVNNAGIVVRSPLKFHTGEDWHRVLRVNLDSLFYCSRAAIKMMLPRRHGRIINIASNLALHGGPQEIAYVTAKAGMLGFTKSLAQEVGPRRLRVNAICPSMAETGMTRGYCEDMGVSPRVLAAVFARLTGMDRAMSPDDVAGLALFLATSESDYLNGQVIALEGGW